MDAIQLERGTEPTPCAPRAEIEAALRTSSPANIIYEPQRRLTLWARNDSPKRQKVRLEYRIVDYTERVVARGLTPPVSVRPGRTVKREIAVIPRQKGIFSVTYAVQARKMPEGELVYLLMPPLPERRMRHELGGNMSLTSACLEAHGRLGLRWVLTCKTRELGSAGEWVHRKPDEWNWFDERASLPAKFKMDLIPASGHIEFRSL